MDVLVLQDGVLPGLQLLLPGRRQPSVLGPDPKGQVKQLSTLIQLSSKMDSQPIAPFPVLAPGSDCLCPHTMTSIPSFLEPLTW